MPAVVCRRALTLPLFPPSASRFPPFRLFPPGADGGRRWGGQNCGVSNIFLVAAVYGVELYIARSTEAQVSPRLNMTYPTALVLQALAQGFHHGFDIMDATGLPSGTVYPILRRLDREGHLASAWEKASVANREQRPPRRYYSITAAGEAMLAEALERYHLLQDAVPRARMRPSRA